MDSKSEVIRTADVTTQSADQGHYAETLSSAELSSQLTVVTIQSGKHKKLASNLAKQLGAHNAKIKAAFEENVDLVVTYEDVASKSNEDIIIEKLKCKYIAEQVLSIPQLLAILPRDPSDCTIGGQLIRERIKLHRQQKELAHQYEIQKAQNESLDSTKVHRDAAEKQCTKLLGTVRDLESTVVKLKLEIKNKDPLFKVGVAVRIGFLEAVKRTWIGGDMVVIRGDPDAEIIIDKNNAVHRANFQADQALFELNILNGKQAEEDFSYVYSYAVSSTPRASAGRELVNLRGTMVACYFNTKYTHCAAKDREFEGLWTLSVQLIKKYKNAEVIDKCPKIRANLLTMGKIVESVAYMERARVNGRSGN